MTDKIRCMKIKEELENIRLASDGILRPEDVVAFARDESTELHKRFLWDDSAAAELYRVEQARKIIRYVVQMEEIRGEPVEIRTYWSLVNDRKDGDSYRNVLEIMRSDELKDALLEQCKRDFLALRKKYAHLVEFAKVFEAIDSVAV